MRQNVRSPGNHSVSSFGSRSMSPHSSSKTASSSLSVMRSMTSTVLLLFGLESSSLSLPPLLAEWNASVLAKPDLQRDSSNYYCCDKNGKEHNKAPSHALELFLVTLPYHIHLEPCNLMRCFGVSFFGRQFSPIGDLAPPKSLGSGFLPLPSTEVLVAIFPRFDFGFQLTRAPPLQFVTVFSRWWMCRISPCCTSSSYILGARRAGLVRWPRGASHLHFTNKLQQAHAISHIQ